ncbi:efflux RND transporter permease subunit [Microbacterium esteraromaticum]|uniref:efflux RND transporter permease subunit n=1 Tax=Microbacterium esteraromaticum TaxID=57043 RepID=UPI001CD241FD|nr:efflux RND transporter permease subunit [Microbacterium esteraromaticum]MCA1307043.1 efflux RND transporter permease subunit [Microbacterium esteraromaticum]
MSHLAVLSLRNRALIALITIVSAVFGGLALTNLKQELIPSLELPALVVMTSYPGASPEVVENDVSTPIEQAVQGVPGLESTTATSTTNASIVQAMFTYGTNLATAEQKMQQAINRIAQQLPEEVSPQVLSVSIDDFPVIQIAVTGFDDVDTAQADLENVVIPNIEDVDGVNAAEVVGGAGQRITVTPDDAKLAEHEATAQQITQAMQQNGVLFPGGSITEGDETLTVQTGAKLTSADEIAQLPLVGTDVTIGDVATVAQETDPVTSISRVDGEDALSIAVTKLPAANTVEVSTGVLAAIDDLRKTFPDAEFTVVFDQAPFIQQSIDTLAVEGLLGLVFAVVVILVFLMSIRSTLVTAISIPTSVLVTFIGLQAFGYSLNVLTLGALTIAIGRVVDDSIVVIENIKRHYVEGADKGDAIRLAVREVASAITASTLTTVAVFLPIVFVGDMVGELFRPFAMTVSIAMAASLLVALTIVPVLAYWFLRPGKPLVDDNGVRIDPEDPAAPPTPLQRMYRPILSWTLKHSLTTVALAVVVLVGTLAMAPLMKVNFLSDSGQNTMTVTQDLGPTASLQAKSDAALRVEEALDDVDGIEHVQVSVGSSGSALMDAFSGGAGVTYSILTDSDVDQEQLRADVQDAVNELDDVGEISVAGSSGFGSSDITVTVTASNGEDLQTATDALVAELEGRDGVGQVTDNLAASLPYIAVVVDREAAAQRGLSEVAVGSMVSDAMRPQQIGSVEIDDTALTVYLASEEPPTTVAALRELTILTPLGPTELQDVATIEEREGPTTITTQQGVRTATVTVPPASDDLAVATASVTAAMEAVDLPAGADVEIGGVAEQQAESFSQLGLAMLAAILIVYVVMVATFKSLRQPLLLLISVPFAATGAILLQIITGVPLGVPSLIGVLMLIGIVVTNAIVLVDLVNQYREKGLTTHDAVMAGGEKRLRPILMTALATIFALTPMALGITGHGGFISQPLAIVVIGGLVSSTVLTLIVLPTLYNLVEGARERRAARRAARDASDGSGDSGGSGGSGGAGDSGDGSGVAPGGAALAQPPVADADDGADEPAVSAAPASDAASDAAEEETAGVVAPRTTETAVVVPQSARSGHPMMAAAAAAAASAAAAAASAAAAAASVVASVAAEESEYHPTRRELRSRGLPSANHVD